MNDRHAAAGKARTKSAGLAESRTTITVGASGATSTQLPLAILCRDLRQFCAPSSEPVIDDIRSPCRILSGPPRAQLADFIYPYPTASMASRRPAPCRRLTGYYGRKTSNFPILASVKNERQDPAGYLRIGPRGSCESRTAMKSATTVTSVQFPLDMLRFAFRQLGRSTSS